MDDMKFSWVQNIILGLHSELESNLSNIGMGETTLQDKLKDLDQFKTWPEDSGWDSSSIKTLLNSYGLAYGPEDQGLQIEVQPIQEEVSDPEQLNSQYIPSPSRTRSSLVEKFDDIEEVGETLEDTGRSSEMVVEQMGPTETLLNSSLYEEHDEDEVIKLMNSSMVKKDVDFTLNTVPEQIEKVHPLNEKLHQKKDIPQLHLGSSPQKHNDRNSPLRASIHKVFKKEDLNESGGLGKSNIPSTLRSTFDKFNRDEFQVMITPDSGRGKDKGNTQQPTSKVTNFKETSFDEYKDMIQQGQNPPPQAPSLGNSFQLNLNQVQPQLIPPNYQQSMSGRKQSHNSLRSLHSNGSNHSLNTGRSHQSNNLNKTVNTIRIGQLNMKNLQQFNQIQSIQNPQHIQSAQQQQMVQQQLMMMQLQMQNLQNMQQNLMQTFSINNTFDQREDSSPPSKRMNMFANQNSGPIMNSSNQFSMNQFNPHQFATSPPLGPIGFDAFLSHHPLNMGHQMQTGQTQSPEQKMAHELQEIEEEKQAASNFLKQFMNKDPIENIDLTSLKEQKQRVIKRRNSLATPNSERDVGDLFPQNMPYLAGPIVPVSGNTLQSPNDQKTKYKKSKFSAYSRSNSPRSEINSPGKQKMKSKGDESAEFTKKYEQFVKMQENMGSNSIKKIKLEQEFVFPGPVIGGNLAPRSMTPQPHHNQHFSFANNQNYSPPYQPTIPPQQNIFNPAYQQQMHSSFMSNAHHQHGNIPPHMNQYSRQFVQSPAGVNSQFSFKNLLNQHDTKFQQNQLAVPQQGQIPSPPGPVTHSNYFRKRYSLNIRKQSVQSIDIDNVNRTPEEQLVKQMTQEQMMEHLLLNPPPMPYQPRSQTELKALAEEYLKNARVVEKQNTEILTKLESESKLRDSKTTTKSKLSAEIIGNIRQNESQSDKEHKGMTYFDSYETLIESKQESQKEKIELEKKNNELSMIQEAQESPPKKKGNSYWFKQSSLEVEKIDEFNSPDVFQQPEESSHNYNNGLMFSSANFDIENNFDKSTNGGQDSSTHQFIHMRDSQIEKDEVMRSSDNKTVKMGVSNSNLGDKQERDILLRTSQQTAKIEMSDNQPKDENQNDGYGGGYGLGFESLVEE